MKQNRDCRNRLTHTTSPIPAKMKKLFGGDRMVFSTNDTEAIRYHMRKQTKTQILIHSFHHMQKLTQKWELYLNVKRKALEENMRKNICSLKLGKKLLDMIPKVQSIKEQIGEIKFIKVKNFAFWKSLLR